MPNRPLNILVAVALLFSYVTPPPAHAADLLGLPEPGAMVSLSPAYSPAVLKGVTVHKDNPFMFDFIVDIGQDRLKGDALKQEGEKLIKYFLASLAIPERDLWVNLSPYEKDRTIPQALSQTEMGRDLLAQDYILKQLTASLIYPEKQLGKTFWERVYSKAQALYGNTTQIPVNTFNKVWIMADRAEVFEKNNTAFVVGSHLKVMLEEDYLALKKNTKSASNSSISSKIIKEIILPELEREVNQGKNFAPLRQIFNSLILASWYKNSLKNALLNQVYSDKSTVRGIDLKDPNVKDAIYQRYLSAYKKGVFNFIKEDSSQGKTVPRKYFSGGVDAAMAAHPRVTKDLAMLAKAGTLTQRLMLLAVNLKLKTGPEAEVLGKKVNESAANDLQGPDNAMMSRRDVVDFVKLLPFGFVVASAIGLGLSLIPHSELVTVKEPVYVQGLSPLTIIDSGMDESEGKAVYYVDAVVNINSMTSVWMRVRSGIRDLRVTVPSTDKRRRSLLPPGIPVRIYVPAVDKERLDGFLGKLTRPVQSYPDQGSRTTETNADAAMISKDVEKELNAAVRKNEPLAIPDTMKIWGQYEEKGRWFVFVSLTEKKEMNRRKIAGISGVDNESFKVFGQDSDGRFIFREPLTAMLPRGANIILVFSNKTDLDTFLGGAKEAAAKAGGNPDAAMTGIKRGGIDLNAGNIQWKVSKDGNGAEINVDPAMIERIKREGIESLTPVISQPRNLPAGLWPLDPR